MPAKRSNVNVRTHIEDTFHTCSRILQERQNLNHRDFSDLKRLMLMSDAILRIHTDRAVERASRQDIYVERRGR